MGQAEDGRVEEHVLPAGEVRMEPCPEFQQRCQPPATADLARAGLEDAADRLEQSGLA